MLNKVIHYFLNNKLVTSLVLVGFIAWGIATAPFGWDVSPLPSDPVQVDAIPDIGENQQIVFTQWNGRSPQDIEAQMKSELSKIDMSLFKDKAHEIWMKQSSNLKSHLEHVTHHESIKSLRVNFIEISNVMIEITNAFDPLSETIYLQYCPMVNNDKGANWLSKEKEIFNPYFGEKMLKCGETKKTIK